MTQFTCIIADDDPWALVDIRNCIMQCNTNFEIIGEATNAGRALDLLEQLRPDLAITDICMGDMSGLDMIEECRRRKYETVFVIVSGYSEFRFAQRAMKNQVHHYVLKPVSLQELRYALTNVQDALRGIESKSVAEERSVIKQIVEYVRLRIDEKLSLSEVADHFFINRTYLSELFKKETGKSFVQYKNGLRMEMAKSLLQETDSPIFEICSRCGFHDAAYFIALFRQINGLTPQQYREAQRRRTC